MKLTTHGLRTRAYATDPSPAIHRDSLRTVFAHGVPAFAHEFPGRKACPHTFSTSGYATSHQCHRLAGHRPIRAFCRSSCNGRGCDLFTRHAGPHVAIDAFPSLPSDSYSISAIWPNTADLELVVKADSDVFVQVKLVGSDPAPFVRTLTVLATADPEKWNRVVAFWRDHAYGYEYLEKLASVLRSHGLSYGKMRVSRTQEATCRAW